MAREMNRMLWPALLLTACASLTPPLPADIANEVKRIAREYNASTWVDGERTTYQIYALRPVRGYRNKLILTEDPSQRALSLVIYERVLDAHRITVLVDEPLDGTVDYLVTAHGASPYDADKLIRTGRGTVTRQVRDAQRIYDDLVTNLFAAPEPPYRTLAGPP